MARLYTITPEGDAALVVRFGDVIDDETMALVHAATEELAHAHIEGVSDLIGAYCTLMVCYNPLVLSYTELCSHIGLALRSLDAHRRRSGRLVEVPVCYEADLAPDLEDVASHAGLSVHEVVRRHTRATYLVCMLGFLPGFAYLSGLDAALATPRLEVPRTRVPAGSVGIGGAQTGLYPLESPGGWRLIGKTPARLYDPRRTEPVVYRPGDHLRFRPIDRAEYNELLQRSEAGELVMNVQGV